MAGKPGRKLNKPDATHKVQYMLPVPAVAEYFKVSEYTVRLWITEGKLQAYRLPPADGDLKSDPEKKRSSLYCTRVSMADWAEYYYKLNG